MTTTTMGTITDHGAKEAHDAVDRVASKAAPAIAMAANAAHRTINRVADTAAPTAEWAMQGGQNLVASCTSAVDACGTAVKARPLTFMAAAVALGYLFGRWHR